MTKYLLSNQVKMYPSAYRRAENDVEANFTSENNVTKSNTLGFNHKSFVEENVDSLTIVCKGYRFEVSKNEVVALFDDNDNSPDAIYVGIRTIYKDAPHSAFNSLVNFADATNELDYATEFQGLAFSDTYSNDFYLQILEKDDEDYKVPDKSKLILSSNQIESSIGKSISQEFSTGKLTASDDITFTKIKTTTGTKAVIIDSSGKLSSTDNSSSYTRTADSGNNIKVLGSITQNTNGKITNYSETDLPLADTTIAGLVSTSTQSFSGKKSFTGGLGATNIDSIVTKEITSPTFYGNFVTCESSANDDKVVSVPSMVNFVLKEGVHVFVQFTNINTKSSPTFKINNTDAKSMLLHKREGTSPMPVGTTVYDSWQKGEVVELVYSEGAWWVNKPYYVKEANNANTATTATKTAQALTISFNGELDSFDGSVGKGFGFYSPTTSGTSGQILKSNGSGNAPEWVNAAPKAVLLTNSAGNTINKGSYNLPVYIQNGAVLESDYRQWAGNIELAPTSSTQVGIGYKSGSTNFSISDVTNWDVCSYSTHLSYLRLGRILKISLKITNVEIKSRWLRFNINYLLSQIAPGLTPLSSLELTTNALYCCGVVNTITTTIHDGLHPKFYSGKETGDNVEYFYIGLYSSTPSESTTKLCAEVTLLLPRDK